MKPEDIRVGQVIKSLRTGNVYRVRKVSVINQEVFCDFVFGLNRHKVDTREGLDPYVMVPFADEEYLDVQLYPHDGRPT